MDCSPPGCSVHGILTIFSLSRWCHWTWHWELMHTVGTLCPGSLASYGTPLPPGRMLRAPFIFAYRELLEAFSESVKYVVVVVISHSVMYDSLQPHELQHTRLPCPSLSKVYHIIYLKTEIIAKIYSLNVIEIRLLVSRVCLFVFFFCTYQISQRRLIILCSIIRCKPMADSCWCMAEAITIL